jgi:hypothetical protein
MSIPGLGVWEASVWVGGANRSERIESHFSRLTEAQDAADRMARALAAHDCSECEVWRAVEQLPTSRPRRRGA